MADQEAPADVPSASSETPPARRRGRPKGSKNKRPAGIPLAAQTLVAAHREPRASATEAGDQADQQDVVRVTAWVEPDLDQLVRDRAGQLGVSISQSFRDLLRLGANAEAHILMLKNIERGIKAVAVNVERVTALSEADAMRQTLTSGSDSNKSINERLDRLEERMKELPATLAESISQSFAPVLLALAGAKDVLSGNMESAALQSAQARTAPNIAERPQSHSIRPTSPPSVGGVGTGFGRPGDKPMTDVIKEKLRGGTTS